MKYRVVLSATMVYEVDVEADSPKQAEEKILHTWGEDCSFDWAAHLTDVAELEVVDTTEL